MHKKENRYHCVDSYPMQDVLVDALRAPAFAGQEQQQQQMPQPVQPVCPLPPAALAPYSCLNLPAWLLTAADSKKMVGVVSAPG